MKQVRKGTLIFLALHASLISLLIKYEYVFFNSENVYDDSENLTCFDGIRVLPDWTLTDLWVKEPNFTRTLEKSRRNWENVPMPKLEDSKGTFSPETNGTLLVHMRIPKTGSNTLKLVLASLGKTRNQFPLWKPKTVSKPGISWTANQEFIYAQRLAEGAEDFGRSATSRQHYFVPFHEYGISDLTWVTVVRNPIERVCSWFHQLRREKRWVGKTVIPPEVRTSFQLSSSFRNICVEQNQYTSLQRDLNQVNNFCRSSAWVQRILQNYGRVLMYQILRNDTVAKTDRVI